MISAAADPDCLTVALTSLSFTDVTSLILDFNPVKGHEAQGVAAMALAEHIGASHAITLRILSCLSNFVTSLN